MKPEIPEGEEEETYMKKIEANDPFEPRLKKLDNINWILKLIGDNSNYLSSLYVSFNEDIKNQIDRQAIEIHF
jgi:hypothetical protein